MPEKKESMTKKKVDESYIYKFFPMSIWDVMQVLLVFSFIVYGFYFVLGLQQQAISEIVSDFCLNATNYTDCLSDPYKYGMEPINAI